MGVEETIERAIIKFPRDLKLGETEELIKYISKQVNNPIKYDYSVCKHKIAYSSGVIIQEGEEIRNLTAKITHLDVSDKLKDIYFNLINNREKISEFSALHFGIFQNQNLSHYSSEAGKLWDSVRKAVEKYFEEKK